MPDKTSRPKILLLLPLALISCLFATLTGQAYKQNPSKQESKTKIPPVSSHVILITINGLRSDFVTSAESYRLRIPTIQSLRAQGAYAVGIEGVFPSQALPSHATIVTGTLPADHGVTSDYTFDEKGSSQNRPAGSIKTGPIWELAKRLNLVTAAAGFPLTAGAAINFNLPDDVEDSSKASAVVSLIEKHRPNLSLVNFTSFDDAQRRHGLFSKESVTALEQVDGLIRKIVDAAERAGMVEETTFVVLSGFGAAKVEKEFSPNVILAKKGWLVPGAQGQIVSWQVVAQSFGGSAAIFVKNPQDENLVREVEAFFQQQAEKPDSPIWRIIPKRDAAKLSEDPRVALYLDAAPSYVMSSKATGAAITKSADRAAHGYSPSRAEMRAAFVIAGKGIKSGVRVEYARLMDVAPTVARLLGLEMKTARGRVITEIIKQ